MGKAKDAKHKAKPGASAKLKKAPGAAGGGADNGGTQPAKAAKRTVGAGRGGTSIDPALQTPA
jgi:hypothetical protein